MATQLLSSSSLRGAYEFLSECPPFSKWNLPPGDEVRFVVTRERHRYGWYCKRSGEQKHEIALSANLIGSVDVLMRYMAHEMIHLHQGVTRMETKNAMHNAAFYKLAEQVGRSTGFDWRAL